MGRGILIFLVFGAAFAAYSVTFPASEPDAASGVIGLYVGKTAASYDGNDAGSYANANTLCDAEYSSSRVCTHQDIMHSLTFDPTTIGSEVDDFAWIHSFHNNVSELLVNNCGDWKMTDDSYGNTYRLGSNVIGVQECSSTHPYACCE